MKLIKVVCKEFATNGYQVDVDSRMYHENDEPLMGKYEDGEDRHLGQISSSFSWAKQDIRVHFKEELDNMFPEGYEFSFEFLELSKL